MKRLLGLLLGMGMVGCGGDDSATTQPDSATPQPDTSPTSLPPVPVRLPATRCARQRLYWWRLDTPTEGAAHETSAGSAAGDGDGRVWGR